jgi:hypothetical protein
MLYIVLSIVKELSLTRFSKVSCSHALQTLTFFSARQMETLVDIIEHSLQRLAEGRKAKPAASKSGPQKKMQLA